jgi:hypothetical protein
MDSYSLCFKVSTEIVLQVVVYSGFYLKRSQYRDHVSVYDERADELQGIWKESVMVQLRYYPRIFQEGLRKSTKYLSHDSRCSGLHPNLTHTNAEVERYLQTILFGILGFGII